jgi:hypothetical protein
MYVLIMTVLFSTVFSFAQTVKDPAQMSEKEFEEQIKKIYEERDKLLSKPQIIYYAPVISPSGDKIAYVKRTLEYRLTGGGLIPFLSDPPEVTWISDLIEICEWDIATRNENALFTWKLPKPQPYISVGSVFPYLNWKDRLYYDINLSDYSTKNIPEGRPCRGSGVCLSNSGLIRNGNNSANGITVGLNEEQWSARFPISNKIVFTCDKSISTCPVF